MAFSGPADPVLLETSAYSNQPPWIAPSAPRHAAPPRPPPCSACPGFPYMLSLHALAVTDVELCMPAKDPGHFVGVLAPYLILPAGGWVGGLVLGAEACRLAGVRAKSCMGGGWVSGLVLGVDACGLAGVRGRTLLCALRACVAGAGCSAAESPPRYF